MRMKLAVGIAAAGLLLGVVQLQAHHAFAAEFDVNRPLTLKGTLVKWEMVNPHSWFHIDVKDKDGKVTPWMVEGGSPNQLIRMGVTKPPFLSVPSWSSRAIRPRTERRKPSDGTSCSPMGSVSSSADPPAAQPIRRS